MKTTSVANLLALATGLLAAPAAYAGLVISTPVDVVGNLALADFTGNGYGTNTYKDWGNEPSVTVNPLDHNQILVSSFAFNSGPTTGANVFFSNNGGASWASEFTITRPSPTTSIPNDWRFLYDSAGTLHGAVLGGATCGSASKCDVFAGSSLSPTGAGWTWTNAGGPINTINNPASLNSADQPWIALQGTHVFVAYDDFHSNTGERVVASADGGTTFPVDNPINNGPQANSVNPGTRIATDGSGNLYSIFGVGTATATPGVHNVTYYLNRSRDGGVTWDFNGSSAVGGVTIASGLSSQLDNAGTQASNNWFAGVNDLRGNVTAIASDKTGSHVYVLYGAQDANGTDRIFLEEFHPVGANLVGSPAIVISPAFERAALPAVTVKDDGTVVMMYETFGDDGKVHVHVASSDDFGATISSDTDLYDFTPLTLQQATGSTKSNREFGDYDFLTSIGNTFYGTFAGLGDVNAGGIDTTGLIDPFFFSGTDAPEPASLTLLLAALGGAGLVRARRRAGLRSAPRQN